MKILVENIFFHKIGGISRDGRKFLDIFEELGIEILSLPNYELKGKFFEKVEMLKSCVSLFRREVRVPFDLYWQQQVAPQFFSTRNQRISIPIVRVHDLFPLTNREWFTFWGNLYFRIGWRNARKDSFFICNSNSTRAVLLSLAPELESRSTVIHCPSDYLSLAPMGNCNCQGCESDIISPYYIAVGTIEPRKNYSELIRSFNLARSRNNRINLVIVGRYGWKQSKIYNLLKSKNKPENLIYIEDCCDWSLKSLIRNSIAFVSPSLDEGFNISAVEARNLRVPLLLSDIAVHRELHTGNAHFFEISEIDQIWSVRSDDLFRADSNFEDHPEQDVHKMKEIIDRLTLSKQEGGAR